MASFAGDRTEKPTHRKLKDAREKGQIARSRDLAGAMSLAAVTIALGWFGAGICSSLAERMAGALGRMGDAPLKVIDATSLSSMIWADAGRLTMLVGPLLLVAAAVSIGMGAVQSGGAVSPKALQFNWERLSPSSGLQKLAPKQAFPELLKAFFGVAVLGTVCYLFVRDCYSSTPTLAGMMPAQAMRTGWERIWSLLWRASLTLVVLGAGDYAIQRWRWYSQVKMTRQEVRDDARQQDGSPELKARVKRVQREMTRRRMLQNVKKATVIITNPTHFAVAIEYRRAEMAAPMVVAKGQDLMAARIREVARKHGVPTVENVALARALYKGAEVGDMIPAALFGAVAEVLAYLIRLKQLIL